MIACLLVALWPTFVFKKSEICEKKSYFLHIKSFFVTILGDNPGKCGIKMLLRMSTNIICMFPSNCNNLE